jgi:hypothetical protein
VFWKGTLNEFSAEKQKAPWRVVKMRPCVHFLAATHDVIYFYERLLDAVCFLIGLVHFEKFIATVVFKCLWNNGICALGVICISKMIAWGLCKHACHATKVGQENSLKFAFNASV